MNSDRIFQQKHAYLSNTIELEALESWLISHLGLFVQDESPDASRLAGLIELDLALRLVHRLLRPPKATSVLCRPLPFLLYWPQRRSGALARVAAPGKVSEAFSFRP